MTDKAKSALAVVALIAFCLAGGMAVGIFQDPNPPDLKDINFWLIMLGIFGGVALIFVLVYYLLRSLRWLGSIIATWAEVSLPTPIFNICRWAVRGIAATWHVLILLVFALTLGRRLFG
jgi:hypothetical protein